MYCTYTVLYVCMSDQHGLTESHLPKKVDIQFLLTDVNCIIDYQAIRLNRPARRQVFRDKREIQFLGNTFPLEDGFDEVSVNPCYARYSTIIVGGEPVDRKGRTLALQ